ncbi:hypothetical protein RUM44_002785 [Polyplax serrata]|uniref:cystathionine gamma-lyase n=1 Tax=Polyplax serrata TaxID=468196 RepID=A0ABR1AH25_POLSC
MSETEYLEQKSGFSTKAIHSGQDPTLWSNWEVVPPICTSTTYKQKNPADPVTFEYSRSGNPTRNVLESCLAALEDSRYALCFSSGLGATTALLFLLNSGDNIICCDDVYGGTNRHFSKCAIKMNISTTFVDPNDVSKVEEAILPNTRMIWIESPTNPLLKVVDIRKVVNTIKKHDNIITIVDNTFLTPYFQKPLELGADITVYSLTKYMNGHSDVVMGAVCTNDEDLYKRILFLQNALGIVPAPFDCFQVNRSLKTLAVRMKEHMKNGLIVAKYLESHPRVKSVLHPGLPSHPHHSVLKKQCYGCSGMLSFYLDGGLDESKTFLSSLKVFVLAESLGGYESLAELPSLMTHASVPPDQRKNLGITDSLIRLSVGLEDPEDLINDLNEAFRFTFK